MATACSCTGPALTAAKWPIGSKPKLKLKTPTKKEEQKPIGLGYWSAHTRRPAHIPLKATKKETRFSCAFSPREQTEHPFERTQSTWPLRMVIPTKLYPHCCPACFWQGREAIGRLGRPPTGLLAQAIIPASGFHLMRLCGLPHGPIEVQLSPFKWAWAATRTCSLTLENPCSPP